MKKLFSAVLALFILIQLPLSAAVADSLAARIGELESKYGIHIEYDLDKNDKPIINMGNLTVLDSALETATPTVVRQVSSYYGERNGTALTFRFTTETVDIPELEDSDLLILGHFEQDKSIVTIFTPNGKSSVMTGCAPISILHEFAHAYHLYAQSKYGQEKMRKEWTALNGSVSNNEGYMIYPYNKLVFMSSYAASSYHEDFAETFAHALIRNKPGQGFSHRLTANGGKTALGKKVDYIARLLPQFLTGTDQAVSNLRKIETTPVTLTYQGMRFSDDKMQFIGMPQPRYVLKKVLSANGLQSGQSQWLAELGCWQVETTDRQYYLAFPGGACYQINKNQMQAAA